MGRTNDTPREGCLLTLGGGRVRQWFFGIGGEGKQRQQGGGGGLRKAEVGETKQNKSICFSSLASKALKKNYQREQVK